MKTSNPALSEKAFQNFGQGYIAEGERMTVRGTVDKSFLLIVLLAGSALWSWNQAFPQGWSLGAPPEIPNWYFPAMIAGVVLSLVIIFKQNTAPYLTPVYAVAEGLVLGAISALFEYRYPGIAFQAMLSTIGTFIAMLLTYRSGLIQVTDKFRMGMVAATGGIALVYVIDMVMGFFGTNVPFIHSNGLFGIAISFVIVGVAALNLLLDFDFIERASRQGAPKYMEWYGAFGLLVTLVWLYIEILRLLGKGRSRN